MAGDARAVASSGLAAGFSRLRLIKYTPAPTIMTTITAPITIHIGEMWSEWSAFPDPESCIGSDARGSGAGDDRGTAGAP